MVNSMPPHFLPQLVKYQSLFMAPASPPNHKVLYDIRQRHTLVYVININNFFPKQSGFCASREKQAGISLCETPRDDRGNV